MRGRMADDTSDRVPCGPRILPPGRGTCLHCVTWAGLLMLVTGMSTTGSAMGSAQDGGQAAFAACWTARCRVSKRQVSGLSKNLVATSLEHSKRKAPEIVCCSSLGEYVRSVAHVVGQGDRVLEIGSQGQEVTSKIQEQIGESGTLVGMDIESRKPPKLLDMQPPNPRKAMYRTTATGKDDPSSPAISERRSLVLVDDISSIHDHLDLGEEFDVCFLDMTIIFGNDLLLDTVSFLRQIERIYPSLRRIVVKSRALNEHAKCLRDATDLASGRSTLAGRQGARSHLEKRCHLEKKSTKHICSKGVDEYRSVIETIVQKGDNVLEIGCHFGTSTSILARAVGREGSAVGVDIGESIIAHAKQRFPGVDFHVCDAYDTFGLMQLAGAPFDLIFLDVGGLSGTSGLLEALALMRQLTNAMGPKLRAVVIKSACMQEYAKRCMVAHEYLKELRGRSSREVVIREAEEEEDDGADKRGRQEGIGEGEEEMR